MFIRVNFVGGPLHKMEGETEHLDRNKVFFNDRDRAIYVYEKTDEVSYLFNHVLSKNMSEKYDEAVKEFSSFPSGEMRWKEGHTHEPTD